jgi:hypothetical protein
LAQGLLDRQKEITTNHGADVGVYEGQFEHRTSSACMFEREQGSMVKRRKTKMVLKMGGSLAAIRTLFDFFTVEQFEHGLPQEPIKESENWPEECKRSHHPPAQEVISRSQRSNYFSRS